LREIDAHPQAFKHDPRARLYVEWLHYVDVFRPLAVLMENVPDVLNHGGQNIAEEICEVLDRKGYVCGYTLLNAAWYGVPQSRQGMRLPTVDLSDEPEPSGSASPTCSPSARCLVTSLRWISSHRKVSRVFPSGSPLSIIFLTVFASMFERQPGPADGLSPLR
jgi:hypothetical protein